MATMTTTTAQSSTDIDSLQYLPNDNVPTTNHIISQINHQIFMTDGGQTQATIVRIAQSTYTPMFGAYSANMFTTILYSSKTLFRG
jgi:hypothetical protein